MADDHQYNLRQRTQPPIPSGLAVTTSSSYLPPQPSQPQQSEQSLVQTTSSLDQTETESDRTRHRPVPTVASLPGVVEGFDNVSLGIDLASRPTDQTAVVPVSEQSNFASVGLKPLTSGLLHQADAPPAVSSEYVVLVPAPQQEAAAVDRAIVDSAVVDSTDEADAEVASYYRDTPPTLQPAPFCYNSPSPRATAADVHSRTTSRQLRPTSRQSVLSVHSRAGGGQSRASSRQSRQSVRSQLPDPVVDLMNRMFEQVAGDAAAQRADADKRGLQQRADADRLQARMEAEMARREQDAAEKAGLQMRVQQLETAARLPTECTPPPPPAVEHDSPPPVTRSVMLLDRGPAAAIPAASAYTGMYAQPTVVVLIYHSNYVKNSLYKCAKRTA